MKRGWQRGGGAAIAAAVIASTLFVFAAGNPVRAQEATSAMAPEAVLTRWFVELRSPPTADGGSLSAARADKAAFRSNAARAGVVFNERFAYDTLFNGLSIEIDPSKAAALSRIEGVKAIYPVETYRIPETEPGDSAEMATAIAMTGANVAQAMGLTGQGVKVAVMDTGIDYHHPDLGGCFGPGCRVVAGYDFVGSAFNADPGSAAYNPVPAPDNDPDDCNGHGTHVAGIIGASGNPATGGVRGVAPGVSFGAYRVFGCAGSTTADIMVAAMERALADGMQVLNMSIGASFQWPQYPTAQAADRLVNRGVAVVASIGNSGANGLYSAGAPGVGAKVIGVASFENTHVALPVFTVTPDGQAIGYTNATGAPAAPNSGSLVMERTGTTSTLDDACAPLPAGSLAGKAALIRRGTCGFFDKARNAQDAGAAAVVLYNNAPGRVSPTVAGAVPITIPVVAVSDTEGALLDGRIAAGATVMTWTAQTASFGNPTGNTISSFSSYGLAPDLTLKPDIAAPGGLIRSTYPLEAGGYATISGTSMASPHTAGAVALLLEARPRTPANAVRTILQNSADPKAWWGNPGAGFLDNVHRQGAGMLDVPGAIQSTAKVEPSNLSLGDSDAGPATHTLTVRNDGASAVTYNLSHAPALATGPNTFTPAFTTGFASVAFSAPMVVVPAGGSASVDVTITANAALPNRSMYGGYIVFTPEGGGAAYRVPYAGMKGDYQSVPILTAGFPLLGRQVSATGYALAGSNPSFTMADAMNVPVILAHFDHQSRRVRVEVLEAATGKSWHRAMELEYFGRNSTSTGFFALPFDGQTVAGRTLYTVPNGSYTLRLSVLKPLGDDANPAHWEVWNSPAFTIARP